MGINGDFEGLGSFWAIESSGTRRSLSLMEGCFGDLWDGGDGGWGCM